MMATTSAQAMSSDRNLRGVSPGNRQTSLLTSPALILGAVGRSFSNTSNSSSTARVDAPSRGSSLSPPPFLRATLRRSSDSPTYDNGSNLLTLGGLARRMPGNDTAVEVERNHLLRSVSHLNKDQTAPIPIIDRSDIFDHPIETSPPFTRFDLLPPPNYEQKIRQPRKPAYGVRGGVRGRSYSDARRVGYPSTSLMTPEYIEAMGSSNTSGFSHAYKGGSGGKAKAIFPAAAAKLRKLSMSNIGASRKMSVSTPLAIDDSIKSNGKEISTKMDAPTSASDPNQTLQAQSKVGKDRLLQRPNQINQTCSHDVSNHDIDASTESKKIVLSNSNNNDIIADEADGIRAQPDIDTRCFHNDGSPHGAMPNYADMMDLINANAGPQSKSEIENINLDTESTQLLKSDGSDPNYKNKFDQRPRQLDQVVPRRALTATTIPSDDVQESRSSTQDYDTRRSKDAGYAGSNAALSLGIPTSVTSKAVITHSITPQKKGETSSSAIVTQKAEITSLEAARSSEIRFEKSKNNSSRIVSLSPSPTGLREGSSIESILDPFSNRNEEFDDPSLLSRARMTDVDRTGNSIIQSRRGSAPVGGHGRRKSAFRFGMMKMNGSSVDINNLEDEARRGSHLEGSHRRQPSEDAVSNASSRGHRLSFSMYRPRQSQDSPRSGTFGLLSKLNRSREQLPTTTMASMDDACDQNELSEKMSQKADAKLTARQFILKAFKKPSLTPVAMTASNDSNIEANTIRTSALDSSSNSGSQDSVSTEATEHVFTAAFGTPQRSNLQTGRAFEGKEEDGTSMEESESRRFSRHVEGGATTRSSRDSSGTSFFSIAEGSHSREAGTPLFDRSNSANRNAGEVIFRTNPAMRSTAANATSLSEEGPLGELIGDDTEVPQLSAAMAYLKLNTTSTAPSQSDEVANATSEEGDTIGLQGSRSLGIDEEQNQSRASTLVPLDESMVSNNVESSNAHNQSNGSTSRSNVSTQLRRPGRSSQLSHLPRLDSMKVVRRVNDNDASRAGREANSIQGNVLANSDDTAQRYSGEHTSDTDTGDDTQEGVDEVVSETESDANTDGGDEESEADTSANQSSSMAEASTSQSAGTAMYRSRPGEISLPPVPAFGKTTDAALSQTIPTSTAASPFAIASGEDSWTRFDSAFTPLETPGISATPTLSNPVARRITSHQANSPSLSGPAGTRSPLISSNILTQTPRGMPESSNSYFDIRSASGSKGEVPPSPSVISRTRATSNGSKRSIKSPSREFPPLPPITPMQVRALEALTRGSKSTAGPSATASTSIAMDKSEDTAPVVVPSRPISIASPQDLLSNSQGLSDRRAADMYSLAMPPPSVSSSSSKQRQNNSRPSLYQQQSRSLIDLTAITSRQMRDKYKPPPTPLPIPTSTNDGSTMASSQHSSTVQSPVGSLTPTLSSLALKRRRSMFEVGAQPPPYAILHKRPEGTQMIFPREEEGKESLPGYSCAVHIEGYLPRKMEFSSPGVQAKDRSWRRQYFVLHGTCLRVYKSDLSGENLMGKGAWGEVVEGVHVHTEPMNEDGPAVNPTSTSAKEGIATSANSNSHGHKESNTINHHSSSSQGGNSGLTAAVEKVNALTGSFHVGNRTGLVKTYSLQGAESGLAADYLKRRHVVRVRVEGEQFLLQTRNDRHVVDWIEAFQAATNVSLDLERRPMPKFITLPRRRRRRRRGGGAEGTAVGVNQEVNDLEEARRRSMMDAGGTSMSRSTSSKLPPARPLGLPGDESPDPSAAFDDMLREDQDDLMNREAAAM